VAFYAGNLRKAGVEMEARHVEEVAFAVVLGTLAMYNRWGRDYEQHRDQPFIIAAMTGMSAKAFEKYEKRRTEFFNSW
jgi:hypothetical protein